MNRHIIQLGRRVCHPAYGRGEVLSILRGDGNGPLYAVRFVLRDGSWRTRFLTREEVLTTPPSRTGKRKRKKKSVDISTYTELEIKLATSLGLTVEQVREART